MDRLVEADVLAEDEEEDEKHVDMMRATATGMIELA